MNLQEIRDRLNAHREHYRVLPTGAMNELYSIIRDLEDDIRDVGKRTRKAKKKPQRSKR